MHRRAIADPVTATAVSLSRLVTPLRLRGQALRGGDLLRLDIHPSDLQSRRNVAALEGILRRAQGRRAVTYDAL